jgi:hypothetical protein
METGIVIIIIAAAVSYLIKTVVKNIPKNGSCSCGGGCSNCPPTEDCAAKKVEKNG